jgi:hypothetical protein
MMMKKWMATGVVVTGLAMVQNAFAEGSLLGIDEVTSLRSTGHNTLKAEEEKAPEKPSTTTLVKANGKVIGQYDSSLITINENVVNRQYHFVKGSTPETAFTYQLEPVAPGNPDKSVATDENYEPEDY